MKAEVREYLAKIGKSGGKVGGKIGGKSRSKAKRAASAANGKLGGRPRQYPRCAHYSSGKHVWNKGVCPCGVRR